MKVTGKREYSICEVQNIGFSNPDNPSWFTDAAGSDPLRFESIKEAGEYIARKRDGIRRRIVTRIITETYFE